MKVNIKPCQHCKSTRFIDHKDLKKIEKCVSYGNLRPKKMNIGEAKQKVNAYLLDSGLDPESPTYRAFTILCIGYDALQEQVNNLEDIDEIAGRYRDLANEAIDEFQAHIESGSSIDYGNADRLRNKFEDMRK